jgi:hypothetical protein
MCQRLGRALVDQQQRGAERGAHPRRNFADPARRTADQYASAGQVEGTFHICLARCH